MFFFNGVQNKTAFRASVDPKGTLSSLVTIKLASTQHVHMYEPLQELLKKMKSAMWEYNQAIHRGIEFMYLTKFLTSVYSYICQCNFLTS